MIKLLCSKKSASVMTVFSTLIFTLLFPSFVFAGGLDAATAQASSIKTWAYGFLGVIVFIYLIYHVGMAMAEKEQWVDVLMALGKVAVAGGILVGGQWAWSIFVS